MRLQFTQDVHIQTGNADGVVSHEFRAGQVAEVPADIAAMVMAQGAAAPAAKAEKATKVKE